MDTGMGIECPDSQSHYCKGTNDIELLYCLVCKHYSNKVQPHILLSLFHFDFFLLSKEFLSSIVNTFNFVSAANDCSVLS